MGDEFDKNIGFYNESLKPSIKTKLANGWKKLKNHRHFKKVALILIGLLLLIVLVQLFWPASRTRPFLKVAGQGLGVASQNQVTDKLSGLNSNSSFELKMADKKITSTYNDAGVSINVKKSAQNALSYPLWQRLIPFSIFGRTVHPKIELFIDDEKLNQLASGWSKEAFVPAKNANIKISGTKVELDPAEPGKSFTTQNITEPIKKAQFTKEKRVIDVKDEKVEPVRKDSAVKDIIKDTQEAIDNQLTLSVDNKTVVVPSITIASWITYSESADKKTLSLDINHETFEKYLAPIQKDVYKKPGVTTINLVDGQETGRQTGAPGRGLDTSKSAGSVKKALAAKQKEPVALEISVLSPTVNYTKTFTKTSRGLTALLEDIIKQKGNYSITVQEVGGLGRYGSANGNKQTHPASTYKLFVAYSALKRIESGELKWEDEATNGKNIDQCFEVMIVNSDNPCAEWFGKKIGWATIQNEMRALGLGSTTLVSGGGFLSTTDDQVRFLIKLQNGSLLKDTSNEKLLSAMKRQVYRAGIPSGVAGTVADKVGFLNGMLHDSAIVYAPGGTYIISIYSTGSTWGAIADSTRQIMAYFNG